MDGEGNIVTPGYDTQIAPEKLVEMHEAMLTINEAD